MIETTYVRLEKAAEMLGTDRDTLLLAAMEGRLHLYGFFGRYVEAFKFTGFCLEAESPYEIKDDVETFIFVPVGKYGAIDLFRDGFFQANILSDPDVNGHYWEVDDASWAEGQRPRPDLSIAIDNIFMKREEIERILHEGKTPDAESVPEQKRHTSNKREHNTQVRIIGGLLELILRGTDGKGERISTYTTQELIIAYLEDTFPMAHGLKKSHLEKTFGEANRAIRAP
jgi:hypothetical protein